jgi:DMSO/TMAO reductase YedYZ molybdopterin-dependent catalytic subunit
MQPVRKVVEPGAPFGRRLFVGVAGIGALGIVIGAKVQRFEGRIASAIASKGGGGLAALLPGANRFRLYSVTGSFPVIANHQYRLAVSGLVEHPRSFTLEELRALPRIELTKDFQCVTGWRVPNVHWAGVRLADLIDAVGAREGATAVEFGSYDGLYTESLTLAEARRSDVIIAYEMLGAPITSVHGGPVRLYVAPMYGYKSAKWLKSISLVPTAIPGFWEQNGYDVEGWIGRSNGRDDAPVD